MRGRAEEAQAFAGSTIGKRLKGAVGMVACLAALIGTLFVPAASAAPTFAGSWATGIHNIDLTVDSSGNLWAGGGTSNIVAKYNSDIQLIDKFTAPGGFNFVTGVTVLPNGNVWAADANHYRIVQLDPTGSFVRQFYDYGAEDITYDASGNLYVANYWSKAVEKFTPGGERLAYLPLPGYGAGVALDAEGNIYGTSFDGYVRKFSPSGAVLATTEDLGIVSRPAVDPSGDTLYVADYNAGDILTFDTDTLNQTSRFGSGLDRPQGVALGNGYLYATNGYAIDRYLLDAGDTVPPTMAEHPNVVAEATSVAGAIVEYSLPKAHDNLDPNPSVSCEPPSGVEFPLGETAVRCTASDEAGNVSAPLTFSVAVVDTTPPTLGEVSDIVINATSPQGAVVNYALTASDLVDPSPTVLCEPPSGATLPIGQTTVLCAAKDAAGNWSPLKSFTVTVLRGVRDRLTDLAGALSGVGGKSFSSQLRSVIVFLDAGETAAACDSLKAFSNHVRAQSGKQLSTGRANEVLAETTQIAALIGC